MQSSQAQSGAETFGQQLPVERLDRPIQNGNGIEYASMNFFRNQVGLDTMKLTMLLKDIPRESRRTGRLPSGDATTLYPVKEVYGLFQRRGIVRTEHARSSYIVLDDPAVPIVVNKTKQYASRIFFQNTFELSDELLDQYLPLVENTKAVDGSGATIIIHPVLDVIKILSEVGIFRDEEKIVQPKTDEEKQHELEEYLKRLGEGTAIDQETFEKLLAAFGPSRIVDIIYRLRPVFRDIPIQEVEKIIPQYLGECLIEKKGFRPDVVVEASKHLSDPDNQRCLYETLRYHCFELFLAKRKQDKTTEESILLKGAVDDFGCELKDNGALEHAMVQDIWQSVEEYYLDLTDGFDKPECLVDRISTDRSFPDMSQRINIKEIREKRRMVIADEMSGGKSASAIIAKEYLKAKLAVICAPSNVISTWYEYLLSDEVRRDGSLKGYFKEGAKPRVLVVEKESQLALANPTDYDYILISHTRMGMPAYHELLMALPYDMFILDEAHKLKNISDGMQSRAALRAMNKLRGDNEYVVMLSGTPVPNKIRDVAFLLKALYPEQFGDEENASLIWRIVNGGIVELRNLLLPRMQMKKLADILDMPAMIEHPPIRVDISPQERAIYNQVFVDDDQFTPIQKIIGMRQFLMNPEIFEPTPGSPWSKVERLGAELRASLEHHDKILVFTNNYVDGILRKGKHATTLIEQLGLPADVVIEIIDQHTKNREDIQRRFNTCPGKMIVFASGQTADVGVDFSGADEVIEYNMSWTKHEYNQQVARANRCTRENQLHSKLLVCQGTIEEGLFDYVNLKYIAIERLLNGIPLTEKERRLLCIDAESEDDDEDSEELADYQLAQSGSLMSILKQMFHIGEEKFKDTLRRKGEEYAKGYTALGNRCYQANVNRMAGLVIDQSVGSQGQRPADLAILDLASGPEMLRRYMHEEYQDAVTSLDLNEKHFANAAGKTVVGSFLDTKLESGSYDYVNCSLGFHYTPEATNKQTETIQLLREMNRLLKVGGRAVITLNYNHELKDPMLFRTIASTMFGFSVIEEFTGMAENDGIFRAHVITLEKREDVSYAPISTFVGLLTRQEFRGLQIKRNKHRLVDSRWIADKVRMNGKAYDVRLNASDQGMLSTEKEVLREAHELFHTYSALRHIPAEALSEKNFFRVKVNGRYVLLKQISNGNDPKFILVKPEFLRAKAS